MDGKRSKPPYSPLLRFTRYAQHSWGFIYGTLMHHNHFRDLAGIHHGAGAGDNPTGDITPQPTPEGLATKFTDDNSTTRVNLGAITASNPLSLSGQRYCTVIWRSWVNSGTWGNSFPRIFDKSDGANASNGWAFWPQTTNLNFGIQGTAYTASHTMTRDEWATWAVRVDASDRAQWFKNGVQVAEYTGLVVGTIGASTTTNAAIGNWNHTTDREWPGSIDFLYVSNRYLPVGVIAEISFDPYGPMIIEQLYRRVFIVPAAPVAGSSHRTPGGGWGGRVICG